MTEFDLISHYFAPLAKSAGAAGLEDDVAALDAPPGRIIVTTDAIVEGQHFLSSDPLDAVAKKLLRVNVSDIIAKGARPFAASIALIWPKTRSQAEIADFARGLGEDLAEWGVDLIGGDTTMTTGPLSLVMTLHGVTRRDEPLRRSGAHIGDSVYITGRIGKGHLGLQAALNQDASSPFLSDYRIPEPPPCGFADWLAQHASASMDVSDGLVADAAHIASASKMRIEIAAARIPLALDADPQSDMFLNQITGGDDYQTLFCAPAELGDRFTQAGVAVTRIGRVVDGQGAVIFKADGGALDVMRPGWSPFG